MYKKGDEIFTETNYKSLIKNKTYIVVDYYRTPGFIKTYKHYSLELKNELGKICRYSPNNFTKTNNQIRKDKINLLIYGKE